MRRARDSLEWTLETLAAATDISRSTLSRIETGARRADVGEGRLHPHRSRRHRPCQTTPAAAGG
ncbi:helix-turn-helix transcriptional regulator [Saccharopolyspora sp. 6M]|uniref:helix-turn-helix domain-containing protein n=1 Tax=Saccharopolyspora sp. 6M TaxID=2877237 RepID=UPI001CD650B2|nr:helix-turn-helix domain-containing protein [Saccharopolyspora sp. 6M]